jgi:hypothetical protein
MKTNHPFQRTLGLGAAALLAILLLAGCNDEDTIIYVEDSAPAVPTGVYTITGDGQVTVVWNPVREEDIAGYGVYRNSTGLNDEYFRIATIDDPEVTTYVDAVTNGVTYYYAVDAFDHAGHESALSYEAAFDTPRPEGFGARVHARLDDPTRSGLDFSDHGTSRFVTAWDAPDTDVFFQTVGSVLFAKGTVIGNLPNDIQDMGWTGSLDDISWAPEDGWSVAPNGVEIIKDHTYVVWTYDNFFAKFRVTSITRIAGTPVSATFDWAYQIDPGNPELSPGWAMAGGGTGSGTS